MKTTYTIVYIKTYSVDVEADNEEQAIKKWNALDLVPIEQKQEMIVMPYITSVERVNERGEIEITEY